MIYADCPWRFETWSENGMDRSADNHYPTVTTDMLCGIGAYVPAAKDSVLFLWATNPMLVDAMRDALRAWGFTYKTNIVWAKDRVGTGFWFRNAHELLLVGTRGNVPAPALGTQPDSVIHAAVGDHSQKPLIFQTTLEKQFPTFSKNWKCLLAAPPAKAGIAGGNESETASAPADAVTELGGPAPVRPPTPAEEAVGSCSFRRGAARDRGSSPIALSRSI